LAQKKCLIVEEVIELPLGTTHQLALLHEQPDLIAIALQLVLSLFPFHLDSSQQEESEHALIALVWVA
jgi:hypothetical protein